MLRLPAVFLMMSLCAFSASVANAFPNSNSALRARTAYEGSKFAAAAVRLRTRALSNRALYAARVRVKGGKRVAVSSAPPANPCQASYALQSYEQAPSCDVVLDAGQSFSLSTSGPDGELSLCGYNKTFTPATGPFDGDLTASEDPPQGPVATIQNATITSAPDAYSEYQVIPTGWETTGFCIFAPYYDSFAGPVTYVAVGVSVIGRSPKQNKELPACGGGGGGSPAPRNPNCGSKSTSSTGGPVNVTTGEEWFHKTDLSLPGPFGLSFTRYYGNQSISGGDLGEHWRHNYDDSLSLFYLSTGKVIFYDSEDVPHYFTNVAAGTSSYDNIAHMTLSVDQSESTYTLKSFDNRTWVFDSQGRLEQLQDRIGNTQVVHRDASGRIANVTDPLGRKLCFYYGDATRISNVGAWFQNAPCPSQPGSTAPMVSFGYDAGNDPSGNPNCVVTDLCSVTDPTGQVWTYGYDLGASGDDNNLTAMYDPLGNVLESDVYDSNGEVTSQQRGSVNAVGGKLNFTYDAANNHTNVTNPDNGESTDFYYNSNLLITSVSGPLCNCNGYEGVAYAYDGDERVTSETDSGNQTAGSSLQHVLSYAYGRDSGTQNYPGPTSMSETLSAGSTRTINYAYYPIGDTRQDLIRTMQEPSVYFHGNGNVKTTTFTYDPAGDETGMSVTGYVGGTPTTYTTSASFDSRGRVLLTSGARTDVRQLTQYNYFADTDPDLIRAGQVSSVTDALGHKTSVLVAGDGTTYSPYGEPKVVQDPNGVVVSAAYDADGRQVSTTMAPGGSESDTLTTSTTYDVAGRIVSVSKPLGNGMQTTFDAAYRPVASTRVDASGDQMEQLVDTFDSSDNVLAVAAQACTAASTACNSWVTTTSKGYSYDTFGRVAKVTDAVVNGVAGMQDVAYTNQGLPAVFNDEDHSSTFSPPNVTDYGKTYDLSGRVTSSIRYGSSTLPSGSLNQVLSSASTTTYTYDLHDNVSTVVDPNGNSTGYQYDDFDRAAQVISPDSGQTAFTYDPAGNVLTRADSAGGKTKYTYDALDRPLNAVSTKAGQPTETVAWTYDDPTQGNFGIGRLTMMQDPTGTTRYAYDRRGLVTGIGRSIDGSLFTQQYTYDDNGNMATLTYPSGRVLAYTYDFADRPHSLQQIASGNLVAPSAPGLLSPLTGSARRATGYGATTIKATTASLREGSAPVGVRKTEGPEPPKNTGRTSSGYASYQRVPVSLRPMAALLPSQRNAVAALMTVGTESMPAVKRSVRRALSAADSNPAYVTDTVYAPFGPMVGMAFGNGTVERVQLDARYRPAEYFLYGPTGATLQDTVYAEDATGNVTSEADALSPAYSQSFTYDDMNRLTAASTGTNTTLSGPTLLSNAMPYHAATYQYDPMGNILSSSVGTRALTFQYAGTTSKLQKVLGTGSKLDVGSVTYDGAGNESAVGPQSYIYSARNLMSSASGPAYGLNTSAIAIGSFSYEYDGWGQRLATKTPKGARYTIPGFTSTGPISESSTASPTSAYDYIYFGDLPVASVSSTETSYSFTDHLGTPTIQTNAAGTITYQADLDPYGGVYDLRVGNIHQPLRRPGQVAEQFEAGANGASDLSYNNVRWYRPQWGRYTQSDPSGLQSGPNTYAYSGGNPISSIDPLGLCLIVAEYHWNPTIPIVGKLTDHGFLRVDDDEGNTIFEGQPSKQSPAPFGTLIVTHQGENSNLSKATLAAAAGTPLKYRQPTILQAYAGPCLCRHALNHLVDQFNKKNFRYLPIPVGDSANSNTFFHAAVGVVEGTTDVSAPVNGNLGYPDYPGDLPGFFQPSGLP